MINLIEEIRSEVISHYNSGEKSTQLPLDRLALLASLKEINIAKMQYKLDNKAAKEKQENYISYKTQDGNSELIVNPDILIANLKQINVAELRKDLEKPNLELEKPSKEISSGVPSWVEMQKSILMGQLQELLHEIEAMQQAGGEYPIAYIINVSMSILSTLSTQMQELTAKPLEHFQEISKKQAIVQEKIEAIKRKILKNPETPLDKEDLKGLKDALDDLDRAIAKLEEAYTFEDNDGNKVVIWPNDEVKDIYEKAKANVNMMQGERIPDLDGKTLKDLDLNNPDELQKGLRALSDWAQGSIRDKPEGAFVEWHNGKGGAQGNSIMKIILDTEISTYTDKLNRDAQLVSSAQSMGQKQVEHAQSLMRGIVGNFISR